MTKMEANLPPQFKGLESWVDWALPTEAERYARRASSSLEELRAFCGALKPFMHDIMRYLSDFEWGSPLGEADENLYHLGLTYMEATIPLDLGWKASVAEDSFPVDQLTMPERR